MSFAGTKIFTPKPPAKGSFPLDHFGDCKDIMSKYMQCLSYSRLKASLCHHIAKDYLQCRMDNDLMAKEDLKYLGFGEDQPTKSNSQ